MSELLERPQEVNYRFRPRHDYLADAIAATVARIDAAFEPTRKIKAARKPE